MIATLLRLLPITIAACALLADASAAVKQKFNLPPSAELAYTIKSQQKGIAVDGEALMRWKASGGTFVASNEVRAMLVGKILDTRSEGAIDAYGLAPATFTEKRFRREPTTTSFDRSASAIRFSTSEQTYPITGGEQDRSSVIWQLISVARGAPAKFKAGSAWTVMVAGQRDADRWTFKVLGSTKTRTPLGDLSTVHIARMPRPDSHDQQLDIWLAPSLEWYPVQLRFSEDNNDFIEQTLSKVNKKPS